MNMQLLTLIAQWMCDAGYTIVTLNNQVLGTSPSGNIVDATWRETLVSGDGASIRIKFAGREDWTGYSEWGIYGPIDDLKAYIQSTWK